MGKLLSKPSSSSRSTATKRSESKRLTPRDVFLVSASNATITQLHLKDDQPAVVKFCRCAARDTASYRELLHKLDVYGGSAVARIKHPHNAPETHKASLALRGFVMSNALAVAYDHDQFHRVELGKNSLVRGSDETWTFSEAFEFGARPYEVFVAEIHTSGGLIGCALFIPEWYLTKEQICGAPLTAVEQAFYQSAGHVGWKARMLPQHDNLMTTDELSVHLPANNRDMTLAAKSDVGDGRLKMQVSVQFDAALRDAPSTQKITRTQSLPAAPTHAGADGSSGSGAHAGGGGFGVAVRPHKHHKYCDRRHQVCTAASDFREGNVLEVTGVAQPTSSTSVSADDRQRCIWYRSLHPHEEPVTSGPATAAVPGCAPPATAPPSSAPTDVIEDPVTGTRFQRIHRSVPSRSSLRGLSWVVGSEHNGGVGHIRGSEPLMIPPYQGADETTLDLRAPAAVKDSDSSMLYSSESAVQAIVAECVEACQHPMRLFLLQEDVGRSFIAVMTSPGGTILRSRATAVIQPATPAVRELWISPVGGGELVVGRLLAAQAWYYGGEPGLCEYSWMKVDAEGNRISLGEPRAVNPWSVCVVPDDLAGQDQLDPRLYHVQPEDVGAVFKVTCNPVRIDGARGGASTSKPTRPVVGAPVAAPSPEESEALDEVEAANEHPEQIQ